MKKQHRNKLTLHRETLASLAPNVLDEVNGGTSGAILRSAVKVSQWLCTTVTTVQSQRIITCK